LPELLRDVDPAGLAVPGDVVGRAASANSSDELARLASVAGAYATGGDAWRLIARGVLSRVDGHDAEGQRAVMHSLAPRGSRAYSSRVGQVPAVLVSAVEAGRRALDEETEPILRPFWGWRLAYAEAELRQAEQRAKEDRGE
jgi:hypothetical protein